MRRSSYVVLLLGVVVGVAGCGSDGAKPLEIHHRLTRTQKALFDYDREKPLHVHVVRRSRADGMTVEGLTYQSPGNGKIAAYVVRPEKRADDAPAIVFLHWTYDSPDRGEFLDEATSYAKRGVVSLLVGEELEGGNIGMVIDIERGVDLLLERERVDPARIGYVGHSLGAVVGGVVAGVETRIRTYVLMAGGSDVQARADRADWLADELDFPSGSRPPGSYLS